MANYLDYFGLKAAPFSMTPDPSFAFATREHEQALLKMTFYTDERQGLFLLMGEVGTGKTTVAKLAVDNWKSQRDRYTVGQVSDPSPPSPAAFLRLILASFLQPVLRNLLDLKAALRVFLLEEYQAGRTVILVLDEAQTIHPKNLDTLHALTNEQTQTQKLLQIVLLAQPNFKFKLQQKAALRSRVAGGHTLDGLTPQDSVALLRHRVAVAGGDFDRMFDPSTHRLLYAATHGVPRDLCILCNAALVAAYSSGRGLVDEALLRDALAGLSFKQWADVPLTEEEGVTHEHTAKLGGAA
ncbi:MAG: ExeA family protein [Gemmataceae bacterium]